MARRIAPPSYIHVIADDESSSSQQPSPKRWWRRDTSVDLDCNASSSSSRPPPKMVCCCFSSSPMPRCCLVAASAVASPPSPSTHSEELRAFCIAARVTRRIGTTLIQRQAASINRQLLSQRLWSDEAPEAPPAKRRRNAPDETTSVAWPQASSLAHPDSPSASVDSSFSTVTASSSLKAPSEETASRIWQKVDRMKRMALFLKNAQLAQSLLLEEMKECFLQEEEEEVGVAAEFGAYENLFSRPEELNYNYPHDQQEDEESEY